MRVQFSSGSYLKAVDVLLPRTVTITGAKYSTIQPGEPAKVVVWFSELPKPLALNQTNGQTLVRLFGDDTDQWISKQIEVFASTTSYQGRTVDCVRLRDAVAFPTGSGSGEPTVTAPPPDETLGC